MLFDKKLEKKVYEIFDNCTKKYSTIEWEFEEFSKMCVRDVNNYLNITKSGKIKQKGAFVYNKEVGDGCDFLIIPKALEAYLVRGENIKDFIIKHKDIHDFCGSKKVAKKFEVYWKGEKQQRLNRFYCSTSGAYIYKKSENRFHHLMKESGVTILNNIDKFPDNINYNWYISKVQKIIDILEPKQLMLF